MAYTFRLLDIAALFDMTLAYILAYLFVVAEYFFATRQRVPDAGLNDTDFTAFIARFRVRASARTPHRINAMRVSRASAP